MAHRLSNASCITLRISTVAIAFALSGCGGGSSGTAAVLQPPPSSGPAATDVIPTDSGGTPTAETSSSATSGAAGGSDATEMTFGVPEPVFQTINDENDVAKRSNATLTVAAPTYASVNAREGKPQNGTYVNFEVTFRDTGEMGFNTAPQDFYVIGADGTRYSLAAPGNFSTPSLDAADQLDPGDTLKGLVSFDVPGTHGHLMYSPTGGPEGGAATLGSWSY